MLTLLDHSWHAWCSRQRENAVFDTFWELLEKRHSKNGHGPGFPVSLLYGQLRVPVMNHLARLLRYNHGALQDQGCGLDFDTLLRLSMEELLRKTQIHTETWLLGQEEQWNLDPGQTELVFTFPGRLVIAPAQVIGTYDAQTTIWKWSWADASIPEGLSAHAAQIREYGEQNSIPRLTTPEWVGEETDCWYMAALACQLCGFHGAYRGPLENAYSFLTFGEVNITPPLGDRDELLKNLATEAVADFRNCSENFEDQRRACCRYFRRGTLVGLSQSELIDSLVLCSPSVLEIAGYPPEVTERIMDMIGGLSDQEIENS